MALQVCKLQEYTAFGLSLKSIWCLVMLFLKVKTEKIKKSIKIAAYYLTFLQLNITNMVICQEFDASLNSDKQMQMNLEITCIILHIQTSNS